MSTTLSPDFLAATLLVTSFKGEKMRAAQSSLLSLGLRQERFTGADIPKHLLGGSAHLSGCVCGSLVAMGLIEFVDRVKSPNANAKGRRLLVYRIAPERIGAVRAWFSANNLPLPTHTEAEQLSLAV